MSTPPAGLDELLTGVDAAQALARVVLPLVQTLQRFEQHGFAPFQADFAARDALAGVAVSLSDGIVRIYGKGGKERRVPTLPATREAVATYRQGSFAYHIPAPAGRYKLTLWFVAAKGQPDGQFVVAADQRGNRAVKADEMGRKLPGLAAFGNEVFAVEQA